jgi:hypothetical protein
MPIETKQQKEINCTEKIEQLYEAVMSQNRQIPVLVVTKEPNENLFPILFQTKLGFKQQSVLTLAHVIALPAKLLDDWNQRIGETLAVTKNGVRLYYPNVTADGETSIRHPSWTAEDVNSWQWNYQQGIPAFAIFLKGLLAEYAAIKPMNWGSCLFYPKMKERLSELRREQLAKSRFESDYIVALEEDNKTQKQRLDEQESEIKQLKEERFHLTQKLPSQYRPQQQATETKPIRVKIRKKAKEDLENKIRGNAYDSLLRFIERTADEQWRKNHFDANWSTRTDLQVIKPGKHTEERIVGYEDDEIFYIALVFDKHEEYQTTVPKYKIKDVHHSVEEYVDVY